MSARRRQQQQLQQAARITGHGKAADNSAAFHATLSAQFLARWAPLFESLAAPGQHVALLNGFADVNDCAELGMTSLYQQAAPGPIGCMRLPDGGAAGLAPPPACPYTRLKQFYYMDLASLLPSLALGVSPGHAVLDMCAAPGGKTLVLAQLLLKGSATAAAAAGAGADDGAQLTAGLLSQLSVHEQQQQQQQQPSELEQWQDEQQQQQSGCEAAASDTGSNASSSSQHELPPAAPGSTTPAVGRLVCNELDAVRRTRLSAVLCDHLPGPLRRRLRVTGHDAARHWARFEEGMYDRVLLDAPCSSERHVVAAALPAGVVAAGAWSMERCRQLAALQLRLLLAGLRTLKPGGRLVYSTCSLLELENDGVVAAALQAWDSSAHALRLLPPAEWGLDARLRELAGAEATHHGLIVLPDQPGGWGPIYLAVLEKT